MLLETLHDLGLSRLEAEIYVHVVTHPPMAASRAAQDLGHPSADVDKAVESLALRGAVIVEDGDDRVVRAAPIDDFFRRSEQALLGRMRAAQELLTRLQPHPFDERVYRLETVGDVLGKCRQMLERHSTNVAVVDAFPAALAEILPSIRKAVQRGIEVYVEAYEEIEIEGAHVAIAPGLSTLQARWGSQQLNVVIDGRQHVAALLSNDLSVVFQAVWTESRYLSLLMHGGRMCEHTVMRLTASFERGEPEPERRRLIEEHPFLMRRDVPGQRELLARHLPQEER